MSDERLNEIEFKVSHQDILLEELNKIVTQHEETIKRLEAALKAMVKRLAAGIDGVPVGPGNEKPPHY